MTDKKQDLIDQKLPDFNNDGIDRRGFLKCMAWAGTGLVWTMSGGIPVSRAFAQRHDRNATKGGDFSFVQISDSHIGFNKPANPDVNATLQTAICKINAMPHTPDFIIHTGDLSQLSKPSEFDTLDQVLKGASAKQIHFVPGEHDMLSDNGDQYLQRYGKGTKGTGWSSFDHKGVHFVGLVNVAKLKAGGMGSLGHEQLEWLEDDLKDLSASAPIVLFAHIPLWTIYPDWGWGTDDSEQALSYVKHFGSVTVLNGHIHQIMQKIEGKEVTDWAPNPEQFYRAPELRDILIKALRELQPILRAVFVLRDVEGLSTAQTAEALNLSHTAVKARLWRGRLQLRERLNRYFRKEMESARVKLSPKGDTAEELRLQGAASTSGCTA